jgi:hypothetical protein
MSRLMYCIILRKKSCINRDLSSLVRNGLDCDVVSPTDDILPGDPIEPMYVMAEVPVGDMRFRREMRVRIDRIQTSRKRLINIQPLIVILNIRRRLSRVVFIEDHRE